MMKLKTPKLLWSEQSLNFKEHFALQPDQIVSVLFMIPMKCTVEQMEKQRSKLLPLILTEKNSG